MNFPSIDQSVGVTREPTPKSSSSLIDPLGSFQYRSDAPLLVELKTMRLPSGDQIGFQSHAGSTVRYLLKKSSRAYL
jgi:hypothetical protein